MFHRTKQDSRPSAENKSAEVKMKSADDARPARAPQQSAPVSAPPVQADLLVKKPMQLAPAQQPVAARVSVPAPVAQSVAAQPVSTPNILNAPAQPQEDSMTENQTPENTIETSEEAVASTQTQTQRALGTAPYQSMMQSSGPRMAPPAGYPSYASAPGYGSYQTGAHAPAATPAAGHNMASGTPAEDRSNTGRRLVIGEGISISGEIEACDHLVIEGTVEASLKGARIIDIAETGVFYGSIEIEEATVAGRFEGELVVNGRLTIRSTGSITGAITYRELAVEAGAVVDGKISPMSGNRNSGVDDENIMSGNFRGKRKPAAKPESEGKLPFAEKATATA